LETFVCKPPSFLSLLSFPPLFVVAFCASAGRLEALSLSTQLPADPRPATHAPSPQYSNHLDISAAAQPQQSSRQKRGFVASRDTHIAPPHNHLLVNPDNPLPVHPEFHFVPSADLPSVAASFKQRVIAVVLLGGDGAMGIRAIKQMGGITITLAEDTRSFRCLALRLIPGPLIGLYTK